ncbi:MAG TPA: hypothetical protein VKW78_12230 [Terriglobales bacterium]|nr:hypothetical protein [Terriglobales bacterium]
MKSALAGVDQHLVDFPDDWEALGWHARIISWQGKWAESEAEYRRVLQHAPTDVDVLLGLADVTFWQRKYAQVLPILDRATAAGAPQSEILIRRARLLTALDRKTQANGYYKQLLLLDPNNAEARVALANESETRFELRIGNDTDFFNFTDAANSQSLSLLSKWNSRWNTLFTTQAFQRFGTIAEKVGVVQTLKLGAKDSITVGGAVANRQPVVSTADQSAGYDHAFALRLGVVRGIETYLEERSSWFTTSQVTTFQATTITYFPRDWYWSLAIIAARSRFDGAGYSWTPAGSSRITFPIRSKLQGNLLFAEGSEDYAILDQVGQFSARTYGGGARLKLTRSQDISGYGAFQSRSHGLTQTTMGFNYGIRF